MCLPSVCAHRSTVMMTAGCWWEIGERSQVGSIQERGSAAGTFCTSGLKVALSATASAGSSLLLRAQVGVHECLLAKPLNLESTLMTLYLCYVLYDDIVFHLISGICFCKVVWKAVLPPSVSRALGIPCRVVTNFGSAHDSDANLLIENLYDEDGERISEGDSIWWVCGRHSAFAHAWTQLSLYTMHTVFVLILVVFSLFITLTFFGIKQNGHISVLHSQELPCLGGQLDDSSRLGIEVWWVANQWPHSTGNQWRWWKLLLTATKLPQRCIIEVCTSCV